MWDPETVPGCYFNQMRYSTGTCSDAKGATVVRTVNIVQRQVPINKILYHGLKLLICLLQLDFKLEFCQSEWLNLTAFLGTADSEVHVVHMSHVIVAYTLES